MHRGTNLPAIGGFNQSVVLDAVRRSDTGVSRVELAERTGLSPQTISNVTRRLLDDGLVREVGKQINGPGKPRVLLALEPRSRYAIGVHLDPSFITSVVTDLEGHVVADTRIRTPRRVAPDLVIERMVRTIEHLAGEIGGERDRFLGIGIATPGPIDVVSGVVLKAPLLEGWTRVPLRDALAARTALPVVMEKDVTAAAIAQAWSDSSTRSGHTAFLYYGSGLGVGTTLNGEVVRGASANAGDIAHLGVRDTGPVCPCGHRGCLGENVSPTQMVREAAAEGLVQLPERSLRYSDVDRAFTTLCLAASVGDPAAGRIVRRAADDIGRAIVLLANLLDLDSVVIGGPYWERLGPLAIDDVEAASSNDPANVLVHPVQVTTSDLGADVAAIGAATLILDSVYSPRPAGLLI